MGKTALVFPGQGSQYVAMGKDLFDQNDYAKKRFELANSVLGFSISDIMFNGPMEELKKTDVTQPALFLQSAILFDLLGEKNFDGVAGHSLGEYSALYAAGSLKFEDALLLVRKRGEAMLNAGKISEGTMAAVIGLGKEKLEEACEKAKPFGDVECANFNSPGQIVISGSPDAVHETMKLAKESGAKIVKELVVSGAFHSELMKPAVDEFKTHLEKTEVSDANVPVYANVTAKPVTSQIDIKDLLLRQLTSPVRWEETITNMVADGFDEFIEVGAGKVLQGLLKRIDRSVKISGVDKITDL
jgi:[acyl-carrier-protein] S-malonyltransferase